MQPGSTVTAATSSSLGVPGAPGLLRLSCVCGAGRVSGSAVVAAGVQFTAFSTPASSYTGNRETKYGINYGAGVEARVKENRGIRLDVRQYNMSKPFKLPNPAVAC